MRVIHLMTTPEGGAARVALNLHRAWRESGGDSRVLVARGGGADFSTFAPRCSLRDWAKRAIQRGAFRPYRRWLRQSGQPRWERFSAARSGWGADLAKEVSDCDVLHLHWVADFVDLGSFFQALPERVRVVWTMHDLWPFTGGCHYSEGCEKFRQSCGACPQWGSAKERDFSRHGWEVRQRAFRCLSQERLRMVGPSRWIAERARDSSLLRGRPIEVVANGIDLAGFVPEDRAIARERLGLSPDAFVALFAADSGGNRRKGLGVMEGALEGLPEGRERILLIAGDATARPVAGWTVRPLGYVAGAERLAGIYSAADVFVHPAAEDNLPSAVIEALACGTPVAAFRIGGLPEIVSGSACGTLCDPSTASALRSALADERLWVSTPGRRAECRAQAEKFSIAEMARGYARIYRSFF